jgi:hypothetical protein
MPWYWVAEKEVNSRLESRDRNGNVTWKWNRNWQLGFRRVSNTTNERTFIFSSLPISAAGDSIFYIFPDRKIDSLRIAALLGNMNALVFDYVVRQKMGGLNLNFFLVEQLPVIKSSDYSTTDLNYIIPRILEIIYGSWDILAFADSIWHDGTEELRRLIQKQWEENHAKTGGHSWNPPEWVEKSKNKISMPPFKWDEIRRAILSAELDTYYARLYGLNRDELRYILDPKDVYGPDFPGETFRVLKEKEEREYGEYRTYQLVLRAWDRIEQEKCR